MKTLTKQIPILLLLVPGILLFIYGGHATVQSLFDGNFSFVLPLMAASGFLLALSGKMLQDRFFIRPADDADTVHKFRHSAEAAYLLYLNDPGRRTRRLIRWYNPFAAKRIRELEKGNLTEQALLDILRRYDLSK